MAYLLDIWENLINIVREITIVDVLDIAILSVLIYGLLRFVKETRAEQLLKGILIVIIVLILIKQFNFKALGMLSDTFFNVGVMAIIIMFQPELRRVLEKMGHTGGAMKSFYWGESNHGEVPLHINNSINEIVKACERLSRTATGALIVVERQTKLGEQIDTGTIIKAVPSAELLCNIFFHNSPLHDGAVIIRDGIIYAAGCFLPKPQDEESIPKELGTRHRAGIGMSENCDAVVIIVSEETGIVSVAENGTLYRSFNSEKLRQLLTERLQKNTTAKPAKRTKNKSGKKEDKQ